MPEYSDAHDGIPSARARELGFAKRTGWQKMTKVPGRLEGKILVVDRRPADISLLEVALAEAGYSAVRSATDARQAAALYGEFHPDLVLLDLDTAESDRFEVVRQLDAVAERSFLVPIVVLCDPGMPRRIPALEAHAIDFLTKPFNGVEVLARVHNMLELRRLHNRAHDLDQAWEIKSRARTMEFRETQLQLLRRLGRMAEYHEDPSGGHVDRVIELSGQLGRAAGLDEADIDLLVNGIAMHDVGKIAIPQEILCKPGDLDPHEFEIVKSHTTIGAQLLSGSDSKLFQAAESIALSHHENWDGSGYPNGLAGEDIPLLGRICAICDVFDALISVRPYKKAWSLKNALAEIAIGRGKLFDPKLVDAFLRIAPRA